MLITNNVWTQVLRSKGKVLLPNKQHDIKNDRGTWWGGQAKVS